MLTQKKERKPLEVKVLEGEGPFLVFGDLHGCLDELKIMFENVRKEFPDVKLVSVGDLVDRGPYVQESVEFCWLNDVVLCLGNHEEKLLRWKKGNPVKMQPSHQASVDALKDADWEYMKAATPLIRIPVYNVIIVHGGLYHERKPELQPFKHIIRLRSYDEKTGALKGPGETGGVDWQDKYNGPEQVIHGHIHYKEVRETDWTLGIDTGCVYGNKLSGVVLHKDKEGKNDIKLFQVPALKTYWID